MSLEESRNTLPLLRGSRIFHLPTDATLRDEEEVVRAVIFPDAALRDEDQVVFGLVVGRPYLDPFGYATGQRSGREEGIINQKPR